MAPKQAQHQPKCVDCSFLLQASKSWIPEVCYLDSGSKQVHPSTIIAVFGSLCFLVHDRETVHCPWAERTVFKHKLSPFLTQFVTRSSQIRRNCGWHCARGCLGHTLGSCGSSGKSSRPCQHHTKNCWMQCKKAVGSPTVWSLMRLTHFPRGETTTLIKRLSCDGVVHVFTMANTHQNELPRLSCLTGSLSGA